MSRTEFVRWATGQNVYAKPSPLDDDPSWAEDVIAFTEVDSTGQYSGTIGDGHHEAFVRAGATPASSDNPIAEFSALLNVPSAEENGTAAANKILATPGTPIGNTADGEVPATKSSVRAGVNGVHTDEADNSFTLTVTDPE